MKSLIIWQDQGHSSSSVVGAIGFNQIGGRTGALLCLHMHRAILKPGRHQWGRQLTTTVTAACPLNNNKCVQKSRCQMIENSQ